MVSWGWAGCFEESGDRWRVDLAEERGWMTVVLEGRR